MSQSVYLYVFFMNKRQKEEFERNLKEAKEIFKEVWKVAGNGFDKKGNIKGLEKYYISCGWDSEAEDLSEEDGKLTIIDLYMPEEDEYFSFDFHNYGGDTKLDDKTDLRDIYLIFAEILSACFGYVTYVLDEYEEKKYSVFFDMDGRKFVLCEDRGDYIRAFGDFIEAQKDLPRIQEKLSKSKELIESFKKLITAKGSVMKHETTTA